MRSYQVKTDKRARLEQFTEFDPESDTIIRTESRPCDFPESPEDDADPTGAAAVYAVLCFFLALFLAGGGMFWFFRVAK